MNGKFKKVKGQLKFVLKDISQTSKNWLIEDCRAKNPIVVKKNNRQIILDSTPDGILMLKINEMRAINVTWLCRRMRISAIVEDGRISELKNEGSV